MPVIEKDQLAKLLPVDFVYLQAEIFYDMTAIELKKILVHRIAEIEDESFLNAIKTILDSKAQSQVISLTKSQKAEIEESKRQIEQGLFIEQDELDKEFDKWLSEK